MLKNTFHPPQKINHVGIAVRNIEKALSFYRDQLGLTVETMETVEHEHVRVAYLPIGNSYIELLEPTSKRSTIDHFINKYGEGIHHIALEIDDLQERYNRFKEREICFLNDQIKEGAKGSEITFIHPNRTHGVLIELCQPKEMDDY